MLAKFWRFEDEEEYKRRPAQQVERTPPEPDSEPEDNRTFGERLADTFLALGGGNLAGIGRGEPASTRPPAAPQMNDEEVQSRQQLPLIRRGNLPVTRPPGPPPSQQVGPDTSRPAVPLPGGPLPEVFGRDLNQYLPPVLDLLENLNVMRSVVQPSIGGMGIISDVVTGKRSAEDLRREIQERAGTGSPTSFLEGVRESFTKELPAVYQMSQERAGEMDELQWLLDKYEAFGDASRHYVARPALGTLLMLQDIRKGNAEQVLARFAEQVSRVDAEAPAQERLRQALGAYADIARTRAAEEPWYVQAAGDFVLDPFGIVMNAVVGGMNLTGPAAWARTAYEFMDGLDLASNWLYATPNEMAVMGMMVGGMYLGKRGIQTAHRNQVLKTLRQWADQDPQAAAASWFEGANVAKAQEFLAARGIEATPDDIRAAAAAAQRGEAVQGPLGEQIKALYDHAYYIAEQSAVRARAMLASEVGELRLGRPDPVSRFIAGERPSAAEIRSIGAASVDGDPEAMRVQEAIEALVARGQDVTATNLRHQLGVEATPQTDAIRQPSTPETAPRTAEPVTQWPPDLESYGPKAVAMFGGDRHTPPLADLVAGFIPEGGLTQRDLLRIQDALPTARKDDPVSLVAEAMRGLRADGQPITRATVFDRIVRTYAGTDTPRVATDARDTPQVPGEGAPEPEVRAPEDGVDEEALLRLQKVPEDVPSMRQGDLFAPGEVPMEMGGRGIPRRAEEGTGPILDRPQFASEADRRAWEAEQARIEAELAGQQRLGLDETPRGPSERWTLIEETPEGVQFWEADGEVYRVPSGAIWDAEGNPVGARWESSRALWDRTRSATGPTTPLIQPSEDVPMARTPSEMPDRVDERVRDVEVPPHPLGDRPITPRDPTAPDDVQAAWFTDTARAFLDLLPPNLRGPIAWALDRPDINENWGMVNWNMRQGQRMALVRWAAERWEAQRQGDYLPNGIVVHLGRGGDDYIIATPAGNLVVPAGRSNRVQYNNEVSDVTRAAEAYLAGRAIETVPDPLAQPDPEGYMREGWEHAGSPVETEAGGLRTPRLSEGSVMADALSWRYLTYQSGGMATKSDLDQFLMDRHGLTPVEARQISNRIESEYPHSIRSGQGWDPRENGGLPEPRLEDYPEVREAASRRLGVEPETPVEPRAPEPLWWVDYTDPITGEVIPARVSRTNPDGSMTLDVFGTDESHRVVRRIEGVPREAVTPREGPGYFEPSRLDVEPEPRVEPRISEAARTEIPEGHLLVFRGTGPEGLESLRSTEGVRGEGVYFYDNPYDAKIYAERGGGIIVGTVPADAARVSDPERTGTGTIRRTIVLEDPAQFTRLGVVDTEQTLSNEAIDGALANLLPADRIDAIRSAYYGESRTPGRRPDARAEDVEVHPVRAGRETTATGPDPNRVFEFRYRLVDLDDLIVSHTPGGNPNPAFPQELQPRLRDRQASQAQIDKIARELNAAHLLTDTGSLDRGSMIIGPDLVVEAGNGRTLALRRAAEMYPENYDAYRAALESRLAEYGFTPEDLEGLNRPVLVRERLSDVDRVEFARLANEDAAMDLGALEKARIDAERLTDEAVLGIKVLEGETIDRALAHSRNHDIVVGWFRTLPEAERNALTTDSGAINREALVRLKNALLYRVYGGEDTRRLMEAFLDSTDPGIKNIESGLFRSLPSTMRLQALIAQGRVDEGLDISQDLARAIDVLARLRYQGIKVPDYLNQGTLWERELDPFQEGLLRYLDSIANSPKKIGEFLDTYARLASETPDPRQPGLIDDAPRPTKGDLLDATARKLEGATGRSQDTLREAAAQAADPEAAAKTPAEGEELEGRPLESPEARSVLDDARTGEAARAPEERGPDDPRMQSPEEEPRIERIGDALEDSKAPQGPDGRYSPEAYREPFMVRSDETGQLVRWYALLSDGRRVSLDGAIRQTNPELWREWQAKGRGLDRSGFIQEVWKSLDPEARQKWLDTIDWEDVVQTPRADMEALAKWLRANRHFLSGTDRLEELRGLATRLQAEWRAAQDGAQTWQMTLQDYLAARGVRRGDSEYDAVRSVYERRLADAILEGRPIPREVLDSNPRAMDAAIERAELRLQREPENAAWLNRRLSDLRALRASAAQTIMRDEPPLPIARVLDKAETSGRDVWTSSGPESVEMYAYRAMQDLHSQGLAHRLGEYYTLRMDDRTLLVRNTGTNEAPEIEVSIRPDTPALSQMPDRVPAPETRLALPEGERPVDEVRPVDEPVDETAQTAPPPGAQPPGGQPPRPPAPPAGTPPASPTGAQRPIRRPRPAPQRPYQPPISQAPTASRAPISPPPSRVAPTVQRQPAQPPQGPSGGGGVPPAPPSGGGPSGTPPGTLGWGESQWDLARRARDAYDPAPKSLGERWESTLTRVRSLFLDRFEAARVLQEKTGVDVYDDMTLVAGAQGKAESVIRRQVLPIFESVSREIEEFVDYLTLWRAVDYRAHNPQAKLPVGMEDPMAGIQAMRAHMDPAAMQRIERAAEELWAVNRPVLLDEAIRSGRISVAQADAMEAAWPHYTPFYRQGWDLAEDVSILTSQRARGHVPTRFSHAADLEGSSLPIKDPITSYLTAITAEYVRSARNRSATKLIAALRALDPDLVRPAGARGPGWEEVSHRENGDLVTYAIPAEYAHLAKGLGEMNLGVVSQFFRKMSMPLRQGATTYNPAFLLANMFRDAGSAYFREGLIPFSKPWWQGMWAALTHNETWHKAAQEGGFAGSIFDMFLSPEQIQRRSLGALTIKNPTDLLTIVPRFIGEANQVVEQGTRLAVWKKLTDAGVMPKEAALRMANSTVNFDKGGTFTRAISQVIPFLNPRVQGLLNTIDTVKDDPLKALGRAALLLAPVAIMWVNNKQYESSKDIPDYEYLNNWVWQIGEATRPADPRFPLDEPEVIPLYIKIPKGETVGAITAIPEAILRYAWGQGDRDVVRIVVEAAVEAAKNLSPITGGRELALPGFGTAVQLITNYDLFRDMEIVPDAEQGMAPEWQYGPETPDHLVWLGQQLRISPRKLEFLVVDTTAGMGQSFNWVVDMALNALGYEAPEAPGAGRVREQTPEERLSRAPVVSRFFGTRGTQQVREEYEQLDRDVLEFRRALYREVPEARRLGIQVNLPSGSRTVNGVPVEIPNADRIRILNLTKPLLIDAWQQLTASDEYQEMNDLARKREMDRIRQEVNDLVRARVIDTSGDAAISPDLLAPESVQRAYREYQGIPQYVGLFWNPVTNSPRVIGLTYDQYQRISQVNQMISALGAMLPGSTSRQQATLLYARLTGDWTGALLSQVKTMPNPQHEQYWKQNPRLADFYPRYPPSEGPETPVSTWVSRALGM